MSNKSAFSATDIVQKLLYEKPLYNYIDRENVNIIVIGFTDICKKFIDISFEVSQVSGYKLNIKVICDDKDFSKKEYLDERPAFKRFFDVDGNICQNSYGSIVFENSKSIDRIDDMVSYALLDIDIKYSYIFIDTGNSQNNYKIAQACYQCNDILGSETVINCICTRKYKSTKKINVINPNDSIKEHKDYKKLKKMALNCHLLWNKADYIDIKRLQREFNKRYNFTSSFSSILSIKYKLNSVGIDFDSLTAAEEFYSLVNSSDEADKNKIYRLTKAEHDRWNVNMICSGWRTLTNLKNCKHSIKNNAKKLHPCIVNCDADIRLSSTPYEKWDDTDDFKTDNLDGLDRVSVEIHRVLKKEAERIKRENALPENDIIELEKLLCKNDNSETAKACKKYILCLRGISSGLLYQVRQYDYYKNNLISSLSKANKKQAEKRINLIDTAVYPIIESEKYTDYKACDYDMIKNIPFILTYNTSINLAIPMELNNTSSPNQSLFKNVESALIINPSRITYFYKHNGGSIAPLCDTIRYIERCMVSHSLLTAINICIITERGFSEQNIEAIKNLTTRINRVEELIYNDEDELEQKINEFISRRRFTAILKNNSAVSSLFYGMKIYRNNPYYTYDGIKNKFECFNGCDIVKYIPFKPQLRISDLFETRNSTDTATPTDFQQDYDEFWKLYKNNKDVWKSLCKDLKEYEEKYFSYSLKMNKNNAISNHSDYFVEGSVKDSFIKILSVLKNNKGNAKFEYTVKNRGNDTYKINVLAVQSIHTELKKILFNPYLLSNPKYVDVIVLNIGYIKVQLHSLVVENIRLSTSKVNEKKKLLTQLSEKGYIIYNKSGSDSDTLSFSYTSNQVKDILTSEGRIFELYVYYSLMKENSINEIANSVTIKNDESGVENEFDIVITSGLKSSIIECKACNKLDQNYYHKLNSLTERYGINCYPILALDSQYTSNNDNKLQKSRGDEYGIKTISKENDIEIIGEVINKVLND